MHGQGRAEYKARLLDPKVSAGLAQKAKQWNALSCELLGRRRTKEHSEEVLTLNEKLLLVNPDPSHLWNHRREMIEQEEEFILKKELELTAACLKRNPKAYGAWFHRKWCIVSTTQASLDVLEQELALTEQFFALDERNFHCWNYRRFVVAAKAAALAKSTNAAEDDGKLEVDGSWAWTSELFLKDVSLEKDILSTIMGAQLGASSTKKNMPTESKAAALQQQHIEALIKREWDFTQALIERNFSNCSAFHYRSKLLPIQLQLREKQLGPTAESASLRLDLVREELELVQNAIFTEPDDQTAWWYQHFVLGWAKESGESTSYRELLEEQYELVSELVEEEGTCKWGLLAIHTILNHLDEKENRESELNSCLQKLIELDPDRANRYLSMMV